MFSRIFPTWLPVLAAMLAGERNAYADDTRATTVMAGINDPG